MRISYGPINSVYRALRENGKAFDRAAERVARASLGEPAVEEPVGPLSTGSSSVEMSDAMVNMMIAQRAFAASIRTGHVVDEMTQEILDLLDS